MSDFYIHESSYVDDDVTIGKGTKIWHFCHIQKGAVIGENCSFGQNVNVGCNVKIGNGVRVQTTSLSTKASRLRTTCSVARAACSPT